MTAGRHMASLLDGVREPTRVSAGAVVAQAVLLISAEAQAADVRVGLDRGTGDDAVRADPLRLRQAVLNLLTNAIHCGPPDSEVSVAVSRDADTVTVAVRDQGPGLTAGQIAALMRTRSGERAHGLGLPITCELVAALSGRLRVESTPGRGSCFSIELAAYPG
ncbi:sensor histidine kinase [Phytohabitans rumicis]|uniref:histidine kinase n=1 Tax=Phytohabitans rumicis TaxID=1076125 RepID=A0A6V8LD32_9ACTN|nr:ATP-binding protein [Phytohabitans rumicis]GFJ95133.1 hypothetical protein Prum_087750 [Phytohabitans rumicis]